MKIKVINEVDTYALEDCSGDGPDLSVVSHWNNERVVEVRLGELKCYVNAAALKRAIDNATNTNC